MQRKQECVGLQIGCGTLKLIRLLDSTCTIKFVLGNHRRFNGKRSHGGITKQNL